MNLSDEQRAKLEALFDSIKRESVATGERLIGQEAELDRQYANKPPDALHALTKEIGKTQASLRETHLIIC